MRPVVAACIIFLALFSEARSIVKTRTKSVLTQNIDPRGTFYPQFGHPYNSPVSITLTDLDSGIVPGVKIGIRRLGSYGFYAPPWPQSEVGTAFVFRNSGGSMIHWGARSTLYGIGPYELCHTGVDVDLDHDFGIWGDSLTASDIGEVEVPSGAVTLDVGPYDCPVEDNYDSDSNYKVELTYPIVTPTFTQDSRVNLDYNNDGKIDIIGGQPLEIEVELGPNIDVTNSEIIWNGSSLGASKDLDNTGSGWKVKFTIDSVPKVYGNVEINLKMKDSSSDIVAEKTMTVHVYPFYYSIYQVVSDPDFDYDSVVDLVAGKNADIVVNAGTDADGTYSSVEWIGSSGTNPVSSNTDESGVITFQTDPVPSDHLGLTTLKLQMRTSGGVVIARKDISVQIYPTNPIKIGFVPMSGCKSASDCLFLGATKDQADSLAALGGELVRAAFPVADNNFSSNTVTFPKSFAIPNSFRTGNSFVDEILADQDVYADVKTLRKLPQDIFSSPVTHVIGVATPQYFDYRGADLAGMSYGNTSYTLMAAGLTFGPTDTAIVVFNQPTTLAHEMGHLFTLPHDSFLTPASEYSNYTLSSGWEISRGPLEAKYSFMSSGNPEGANPNVWVTRGGYLRMFKENLAVAKKKPRSGINIQVESIIRPDGTYKNLNTYFNQLATTPEDETGQFTLEIKDSQKQVLFTQQISSLKLSEADIDALSFNIAVPVNAVFIDIFKNTKRTKSYVGSVVIPADILTEEVKYIVNDAIIGTPEVVKSQLTAAISHYRSEIIGGNFKAARNILNSEVFNLANSSLKNIGYSYSGIEVGKSTFNSRIMTSFLRTSVIDTSADPANDFVKILLKNGSISGQRSKLAIVRLKSPANAAYSYVQKAWFDGNAVEIVETLGAFTVESAILTAGSHQWSVQTYQVRSSTKVALQGSITQFRIKRIELQQKYEIETDLQKREILMAEITKLYDKIAALSNQYEGELSPVGSLVVKTVEVP